MEKRNSFNIFEGIELKGERVLEKKVETISEVVFQLVNRRIKLGYTQRDLAEISGIKQPMIARIETLSTMPRLDTLVTLATALDLDVKCIDRKNVMEEININLQIKFVIEDENNYSLSHLNEYGQTLNNIGVNYGM